MAITWPYVTDKFTAYPGDTIITNLSMAVWLTDDFTGREPVGNIKVIIKEGNIKAGSNLSGYHIFTDLAAGNYTVRTESDLYFSEDVTVDTAALPPKNPVVEIALKPKPSYPFPDWATLVRGLVSNTGSVADAEISVTGRPVKSKSDEKGEFVLYFKGVKKEGITVEIKKGGTTKTVNVTIEEGKTISAGIIKFI